MSGSVLRKTAAILALLAAPAMAVAATVNPFGGNAWPIYAFANGNVLYNLLYAAKGLVASSGYWDLIMLTAMVALLPIGYAAAHNHSKSRGVLGLFVGLSAITIIGVKSTADAVIIDPVSGYTNAIDGAPALVVLPESIISSIGHEASELIEQFFSTPNNLQVAHGGGFDLANSLVQDSTTVQVTDPLARSTLAAFAHNCIMPGIASGRLSSYTLVTSTKLWGAGGTLANVPQSPLTPVYTAQDAYGAMLPCGPKGVASDQGAYVVYNGTQYRDAYDYLSAYFKGEAPKWLAQSAATFSTTSAYSWLSSTLASAQTFLFGGALTQTTGESIEQAATINALRPALNAAAVAAGQSQAVTALAVSQGEQSQVSSWATAALIFRDLSGYLYSVLQAFVMALLPIITVALFIPGAGHRIALTTVQVLFWLALWEPTLSIVDYIVDLYSQGTLGPVVGQTGGYSMMNLGVISTQTSHLMLAASFIASMVPLITWGLVKGGFAFTEFLTHGMGNALAAQAGAMAATGNVSLGQKSFDNTSIDQEMLMFKESAGTGEALVSQAGVDATRQVNIGGTAATVAGQNLSNLVSARVGRDTRRAETIAHNASQTASEDSSRAYTQGMVAATNVLSSLKRSDSFGGRKSLAHAQDLKRSAEHAIASGLLLEAGDSTKVNQSLERMARANIDAGAVVGAMAGIPGKGAEVAGKVRAAEEKYKQEHGGKPMTSAQIYGALKGALDSSSDAKRSRSGKEDDSTRTGADLVTKADEARDFAHSLAQLSDYAQGFNRNDAESLKHAAGLALSAATSYQTAASASEVAEKGHTLSANLGFVDTAEALTAVRAMERQLHALPDPAAGPAGAPSGYGKTQEAAGTDLAALRARVNAAGRRGAEAAAAAMPEVRKSAAQARSETSKVPEKIASRKDDLWGGVGHLERQINDTAGKARSRFHEETGKTRTGYGEVQSKSNARLHADGDHIKHWIPTLGKYDFAPVHGDHHLLRDQVGFAAGVAAAGKLLDSKVGHVVTGAALLGYAAWKSVDLGAKELVDHFYPPPAPPAGAPMVPQANPPAEPSGHRPADSPAVRQALEMVADWGPGGTPSETPAAVPNAPSLTEGLPRAAAGPPDLLDRYLANPPRRVRDLHSPIHSGVAATASANVVLSSRGRDGDPALSARTRE